MAKEKKAYVQLLSHFLIFLFKKINTVQKLYLKKEIRILNNVKKYLFY